MIRDSAAESECARASILAPFDRLSGKQRFESGFLEEILEFKE
jgi:hypothetical protein